MSHRILVVDDEQGVREALRQLLEYEGYTIGLAGSGSEALDAFDWVFLPWQTVQRRVFSPSIPIGAGLKVWASGCQITPTDAR